MILGALLMTVRDAPSCGVTYDHHSDDGKIGACLE
jgi:hypothetical protein